MKCALCKKTIKQAEHKFRVYKTENDKPFHSCWKCKEEGKIDDVWWKGIIHGTVNLIDRGMKVKVDTMIAPLIQHLWDNDIQTTNSCQENKPKIVWIQFFSFLDLSKFMSVVLPKPTGKYNNFYDRVLGYKNTKNWNIICNWDNWGEKEGKVELHCFFSLRFPQSDLPKLMAIFEDKEELVKKLDNYRIGDHAL